MTTAGDVGERALVRRLVAGHVAARNLAGLEDDAAVLPWPGGLLVASTDVLQADTHFPPAMTPGEAGAYAVNANLSDLAAMGAEPVGLLVALGLPPDTPLDVLDRLRDGVRAAADAASAEVLGGDTKAHRVLTVAVTALGRCERPLLRSGARPGDVLAVTGDLGGAPAGFRDLVEGLGRARATKALRPVPRLAEGRALAAAGASACMDESDGFSSAVHDLARRSGAGAVVDPSRLPLGEDVRGRPEAVDLALHGAGDYELVAAVPADLWDAAAAAVAAAGGRLTAVGRFVEGEGVRTEDGAPLPARGFEHFAARK